MVVLEGANNSNSTMPMLTIGNNQYLQPDYLSSNPTTVSDFDYVFFFLAVEMKLIFFCFIYFLLTAGCKKESFGSARTDVFTNWR